jgi:hypothetical protein
VRKQTLQRHSEPVSPSRSLPAAPDPPPRHRETWTRRSAAARAYNGFGGVVLQPDGKIVAAGWPSIPRGSPSLDSYPRETLARIRERPTATLKARIIPSKGASDTWWAKT